MEPGHTKFSPDRHFGSMKQAYNNSDKVETCYDCLDIVKKSSKKNIVIDIMQSRVPIFDWEIYVERFFSNRRETTFYKGLGSNRIFGI
jgi:hypothetical protein